VRVKLDGGVREFGLEDYVAGCVVAELGPVSADAAGAARARDVQAILCRSFAVADRGRHASDGFDLCATTHCQAFRPAPDTPLGRLARESAARTAGLVVLLAGQPVRPLYHADCGGRTSAARDVWGGTGDPLFVSQRDEMCERRPGWQLTLSLARLERILRDDPRTAVEGPLEGVAVARRDAAGRAATLTLTGRRVRTVPGVDFREVVARALGPGSLRSTLFTITRRNAFLMFDGRGSGHGVGLCQAGAVARAASGDSPEAIIAHYYPGSRVGRMR
jgi:stage II sporulation protein D